MNVPQQCSVLEVKVSLEKKSANPVCTCAVDQVIFFSMELLSNQAFIFVLHTVDEYIL